MKPSTTPRDYHIFDDARSIEFYTRPTEVLGLVVVPRVSDWDELSRASSEGGREPMESMTAHLSRYRNYYEDRSADRGGPVDVTLEFTYSGTAASALLEECSREGERYGVPHIYLWRFRVTGVDGRVVECCFRAYVFGLVHDRAAGKVTGAMGVIDAQPLIAPVGAAPARAAASPPRSRQGGRD